MNAIIVQVAVSSTNRDHLPLCETHPEQNMAIEWQNETIIVREMQGIDILVEI